MIEAERLILRGMTPGGFDALQAYMRHINAPSLRDHPGEFEMRIEP